MAESKTTYVFDGEIGNQAKTVVMGITTNTAAGVLKTFLNAHSDGELNAQSYSSRVMTSVPPGVGSNTDRRGEAYFQDVTTGSTIRIGIPAIKAADTEKVPGRDGGERLTAVFMGLMKVALQTATGRTLRSLYGVVVQKK